MKSVASIHCVCLKYLEVITCHCKTNEYLQIMMKEKKEEREKKEKLN